MEFIIYLPKLKVKSFASKLASLSPEVLLTINYEIANFLSFVSIPEFASQSVASPQDELRSSVGLRPSFNVNKFKKLQHFQGFASSALSMFSFLNYFPFL